MKFAVVALFALTSVSANAAVVGPDSSFAEIKSAGLIAGFSTIFFQTEGVTVDELCVDGDNLRPVQPNKTTCAKYERRGERDEVCVEYVTTYLTTPIMHEEEKCVLWDTNPNHSPKCLKSEVVTVAYPLDYMVSIYKNTPRAGLVELFQKPYTIPACN